MGRGTVICLNFCGHGGTIAQRVPAYRSPQPAILRVRPHLTQFPTHALTIRYVAVCPAGGRCAWRRWMQQKRDSTPRSSIPRRARSGSSQLSFCALLSPTRECCPPPGQCSQMLTDAHPLFTISSPLLSNARPAPAPFAPCPVHAPLIIASSEFPPSGCRQRSVMISPCSVRLPSHSC